VAAAVTSAASNILYLREVDRALGLRPTRRGYLQLIAPLAAALAVCLFLRARLGHGHAAVVIGSSLVLAYFAFSGVALLFGRSPDDRLVANTIWKRLQGWRGTSPNFAASQAAGATSSRSAVQ